MGTKCREYIHIYNNDLNTTSHGIYFQGPVLWKIVYDLSDTNTEYKGRDTDERHLLFYCVKPYMSEMTFPGERGLNTPLTILPGEKENHLFEEKKEVGNAEQSVDYKQICW